MQRDVHVRVHYCFIASVFLTFESYAVFTLLLFHLCDVKNNRQPALSVTNTMCNWEMEDAYFCNTETVTAPAAGGGSIAQDLDHSHVTVECGKERGTV